RVDGVIPADNPPYTFGGWLLESPPALQADVFWSGLDAMAAVHRVDADRAGLASIARPEGVPGADAELIYLADYVDRVCGTTRHALVDDAMRWLDVNRPDAPE